MDRLEAMRVFVTVADEGGFTAAARSLGMPLATVSRKVAELEDALRAKLLTRSTRHVALTETGEAFAATCRRVMEDLGEAERLASGEYHAPRGHMVVAAPIVLGRVHLGPLVGDFLSAYPDVTVELRLTDSAVQLADDHVDIAVTLGDLPDSSLKALRVGLVRRVVVASPDYIARHAVPSMPEDLRDHSCIGVASTDAGRSWQLGSPNGPVRMAVRPRLTVTTADAAADAAVAGVGIAWLYCHQISEPVRDGRLSLLMREHWGEPVPVHMVYSRGRTMPQKLKSFIDFVAPRLKPRLVFDP